MEGGQPLKKKAKVSARLNIPKEFMVQSAGHGEKFLKCNGDQISVEARPGGKTDSGAIPTGTKFSLWWLPEINNACRIRAIGSKAKCDKRNVRGGLAGGLNLAFKFNKRNVIEAPVFLQEARKGQKNEAVNFVVSPSSVTNGAFRFEAASRKGCFLAFTPPSRLGVIALDKDQDQKGVLDFTLNETQPMPKQ